MKVKFSPLIKEVRGRMGDTIFRLCHTGEFQITRRPNMSKVKWSPAQQAHREHMAEANAYASCVKDYAERYPDVYQFYLQMAWEKKGDKRWYDMAVSDYYHNRINRMGPGVIFWFPEQWRADVELRRKRRKRKPWWWGQK